MKKSNKSVKSISSDIIRSKMIVDAAEKNAVVMNGEKIMNVPVDLCFVDKNYQREIRGTRSSIIMDMAITGIMQRLARFRSPTARMKASSPLLTGRDAGKQRKLPGL